MRYSPTLVGALAGSDGVLAAMPHYAMGVDSKLKLQDRPGLHKSPPKLAWASLDLGHSYSLGVYKNQWVTKPIGTQIAANKVALS